MTGYGRASVLMEGKKVTAEIKSLNSKAFDLSTRIAPAYREKEMEIRGIIARTLERGKVDFCLWIEKDEEAAAQNISGRLAASYMQEIQRACERYGIPQPSDWWSLLSKMPEVVNHTECPGEVDEQEWTAVRGAVEEAVAQLMDFRRQEGEALQHKFEQNLDNIRALLDAIAPYEAGRIERVRQRLTTALQSIPAVEYDRGRLEQELIFYIEKLDINEEKQRLLNHLDYFRRTMSEGQGQGKKLGFIAQEMGREINTTGSKSNDAEMQNLVVRMKDELEQIKEQVLNVM